MQITAVSVGKKQPLRVGNRDTVTGIYKEPATGDVAVGLLGLQDDVICDGRHHGGPDQAVYLYSSEDYAFWGRQLGEAVLPGSFGDNLTTRGLDLGSLAVGDVLRSERLVLQVTAPRIPCNTLASRMGNPKFVKLFVQAARPGVYCRVLEPGLVSEGDEFKLQPWAGERITIVEFFQESYRTLTPERIRTYLDLPIDERSRGMFEKKVGRR